MHDHTFAQQSEENQWVKPIKNSIKPVIGKMILLTSVRASAKLEHKEKHTSLDTSEQELGSVAGPVIQANGRLIFDDDLRSGGLLCFTTQ